MLSSSFQMEDAATKDAISKDHRSKYYTEGMRARPLHFGEPIAARLGVDYPFPPHLDLHQDVEGKYNSSGVTKTAKSGNKRSRCETIVGPGIDKDVAHEAVGVKPSTLVPKEIPMIKKKNPVIQIRIAPKVIHDGKVNNINNDGEEREKEANDLKPYATLEDLERGKLPPEEILSLPMFKNYTTGSPTSVLYIKNLAKDVLNDDLYYIFGSLFEGIDEAKSALTVKLMQEGRMRGQAFVTFPSVELAQHALNLVNGYVFKGKPMIIQFGRNPGAAKGS